MFLVNSGCREIQWEPNEAGAPREWERAVSAVSRRGVTLRLIGRPVTGRRLSVFVRATFTGSSLLPTVVLLVTDILRRQIDVIKFNLSSNTQKCV